MEIVNKVSQSSLEIFDLEDYYQNGVRTQIDISQWLFEGILLKEKEFREELKTHSWEQYNDHFVYIQCTTNAILPSWASILVTSYACQYAKKVILGTIKDLETAIYIDEIKKIDFSIYINKPVILKGCSKKPVPDTAYVMAIQELQKVAKSIMYGEACSAVPIFKSKN